MKNARALLVLVAFILSLGFFLVESRSQRLDSRQQGLDARQQELDAQAYQQNLDAIDLRYRCKE